MLTEVISMDFGDVAVALPKALYATVLAVGYVRPCETYVTTSSLAISMTGAMTFASTCVTIHTATLAANGRLSLRLSRRRSPMLLWLAS